MTAAVYPLLEVVPRLFPASWSLKLMCVPFEIASFLQLEFLRGRFATTG